MTLLICAAAVAALLLATAGATKLFDPVPTGRLLAVLGLPGPPAAARVLGVAEIACGVAVLVGVGPAALVAMSALYAAFAAVLFIARRRQPDVPCGCFGATSSPPGRRHLASNVAAAGVAGIGAALDAPGLFEATAGVGAAAAAWIGAVAAGTVAALVLLWGGGHGATARRDQRHAAPRGVTPSRPGGRSRRR